MMGTGGTSWLAGVPFVQLRSQSPIGEELVLRLAPEVFG